MSLFSRLLEKKVADASALTWDALTSGWATSKSGVPISDTGALRLSVVFGCCRVLTEDVGKIPLKLMLESPSGVKEVAREHPLHYVLAKQPNEFQTSMQWRMTMLLHALLSHGGYSLISRTPDGSVASLTPIQPSRVAPQKEKTGRVWYEVTTDDGGKIAVPRESMHVLQGMSWDGLGGLNIANQAREALGLSAALEESQARLHRQGARPGGVISSAQPLNDKQVARIKKQFADNYEGLTNAFRTMLLDNGMEFKPWAMTGVDAQHLETRRHQVEEVCRYFRVFPSMVGYSDKAATYASAESFFGAHVIHSLMPWVTLWEQSLDRDLLSPEERKRGYFTKFVVQGLLRGDAAARAAFYESGITKGFWMTRNEARALEDLNPLPGLDDMLEPTNNAAPAGAKPGAEPEESEPEAED